jgi:hypothetical protein
MCIYLDAKYVKTQFYTLYNIINLWLVFFYITVTVAVTITTSKSPTVRYYERENVRGD